MRMMSSAENWGAVAKLLHWTMAVAILGLVFYGWWMTEVPPRAERIGHYQTHSMIAYYVLLAMMARIMWRFVDRDNPAAHEAAKLLVGTGLSSFDRLQHLAAKAAHIALYIVTMAVLASGWVLHSAFPRRFEVELFGRWPVPLLFSEGNRSISKAAEEVHESLSNLLFALVVAHVAAAVWHHVVKRDNVLRRMWH